MAKLNESNRGLVLGWRIRCTLDLGEASIRLDSALRRLEHARTRRSRTVAGGIVIGRVRYGVTEHYYGEGAATILRLTGKIVEGPDGTELRLMASPSLLASAVVSVFVLGAVLVRDRWVPWILALALLTLWIVGFQAVARELRGYLSSAFNADINVL
jgi:hypothetical protein